MLLSALGHGTGCFSQLVLGRSEGLGSSTEANGEGHRLGLADLGRQIAIAHRLPRLTAEALELALDLGKNVFESLEILLGGLEPQLGLMAAAEQAVDARGFLENAAPRLGLGRDDRTDPALADDRRRMRADRSIGEQELHVAGADLAAIDAIS
jgi:hypothetical protein